MLYSKTFKRKLDCCKKYSTNVYVMKIKLLKLEGARSSKSIRQILG